MSLRGYKPKTAKAPWTRCAKQGTAKALSRAKKPSRTRLNASRGPLKMVPDRKASLHKQYVAQAKEFVQAKRKAGETCPIVGHARKLLLEGGMSAVKAQEMQDLVGKRYGCPVSNKLWEVHHIRGRCGRLLLDGRFWLAVGKAGHRFIHAHPAIARAHGWLAEKGLWNKTP